MRRNNYTRIKIAVLFAAFMLEFAGQPQMYAQERLPGSEIESLIADGATPKLIADGFKFTEGPAADG